MNSPRHITVIATLVFLAPLPGIAVAVQPAPPARPNILFIMSDDHAAHAIGAYGGRLAALHPTPVLDQMAREGALFTNVFCTNSICTPSRASILTGQYSHRNGVLTLEHTLAPAQHALALEMRRSGFLTAMIGKWHLGTEPNFDYYKVLPGQGLYFDPVFHDKSAGAWPDNKRKDRGHVTDVITDHALAWLRQRDRSRPFFLMLHHKAPHDLFEYAPRYEQFLQDIAIPEPESLWRQPRFGSIATRGDHDELLGYLGSSVSPRSRLRSYVNTYKWGRGPAEAATRQAYNEYMKRYLRCVKGIDDNLQRVFDALRAEGVYDDTIVVYTSDQGMMLGEHDYQDKRWMYEESLRMPLLIRYPKAISPGTRSDAIVENVDFAPTLLDFAGGAAPTRMQGRSFRQICETGREPAGWKQTAYYRYWMHLAHHQNPAHVGLRTKRHKLIFYYGCDLQGSNLTPPGWELYDLEKDPQELINVFDDPAYAGVAGDLKAQLQRRRQEIGDTDETYPAVQAIFREFWAWDQKARDRAVEISHVARQRFEADLQRKSTGGKKQNRRRRKATQSPARSPAVSQLAPRRHRARWGFALLLLAGLISAGGRAAPAGPFQPDWDSLRQYRCPDWFRDAKLGIYAHWGPYAVAKADGGTDWYGRNMYKAGHKNRIFHEKTFGPVSKFGYKDLIPLFTGEKFNADEWVDLYVEAGARFAGPVAEHADGFSMWRSTANPWNAADMGPKRDIVGEMERAVRQRGLKFLASFHHSWLWGWFPTWDRETDAADPRYASLYGPPLPATAQGISRPGGGWDNMYSYPLPTDEWQRVWLAKVQEVVSRYSPDLLYFDNRMQIISERSRKAMVAHFYNHAAGRQQDAVLTYKRPDLELGTGTVDLEQSRMPDIYPDPWMTDASLIRRGWSYSTDMECYSADRTVDYLVDIVSKNGCLLLNLAPHPDGTIPEDQKDRLRALGRWLRLNGEAIYGSRPWLIFGEGPTQTPVGHVADVKFEGFTSRDIRFTTRGGHLYAIALGWPETGNTLTIGSLGTARYAVEITEVSLVGHVGKLTWRRLPEGLVIDLPSTRPCEHAFAFKITRGAGR